MPRTSPPFLNIPKSKTITRRRYPEEWAWWAASGWQMMIEDGEQGVTYLHSYKKQHGTVVWGATATAEETASPDAVRRFLTETLYFHLHPRKSRRLYQENGPVCTEKELLAFVHRQRRKAAKPPL